MNAYKVKAGKLILAVWAVVAIAILFLMAPIAQDPAYYKFSDIKPVFNIPNALNVLSNLPFLWVGLVGMLALSRENELTIVEANKSAYYALFLGTALVAFGSGYFHWWPANHTLLWDRLPMTIAFMGLVSIIITEFISPDWGRRSLYPLLLLGIFSVLYWHFTEAGGQGDLRPYVFVQFFPVVAIPVTLALFPSRFSQVSAYWWLIASYVAAKVFEHFDPQFHQIFGVISGHSIKHLVAALGVYILLRGFRLRRADLAVS